MFAYLQEERRFTDTRIAAQQDQAALDDTAAHHAIKLR